MKYDFPEANYDEASANAKLLAMMQPNLDVLECGCATGFMTRYLRDELQCRVSIVEIDEPAFQIASQFAVDGICADLQGDVWSRHFQGRLFDAVILSNVLEHIVNPADVVARAAALLKPEGIMLVCVPNVAHNDVILNLLSDDWHYTELGLLDETHTHFFAKKNIEDMLEQAGMFIDLEDRVYLNTLGTEQEPVAEGVPEPVMGYLKTRATGEVYQYVLRAAKAAPKDHGTRRDIVKPGVRLISHEDYERRLERELTEAQTYIRKLEAESAEAHGQVRKMEPELAEASSYIAEMEVERVQAHDRIQTVEAGLAGAQTYIAKLESERTAAHVRVQKVEADLAEALAYIEKIEPSRVEAHAYIAELESGNLAAQERVKSVETELVTAQGYILKIEADNSDLLRFSKEREAAIEDARIFIEKLEADIAGARQAIQDLEGNMVRSQSDKAELESLKQELEKDLSNQKHATAYYEKLYKEVSSSALWKMAQPLRSFGRMFGDGSRKDK